MAKLIRIEKCFIYQPDGRRKEICPYADADVSECCHEEHGAEGEDAILDGDIPYWCVLDDAPEVKPYAGHAWIIGSIGNRGKIIFMNMSIATTRHDAIGQAETRYGPRSEWHSAWQPMKIEIRLLK